MTQRSDRVVPGSALRVYRRLLGYARPYRSGIILALLASALSAGSGAFYAYLVGPLLKAVLTRMPVKISGLDVTAADLIWRLPVLVVALAGVKAVAQFVQNGLMQSAGQKVMADLRRDLYGHLLFLPPSYFESRHSGELLSRFTADVAQVEFAVGQALSSYVKDTLQVLALLLTCLMIDVRLFFIAFILLPAAGIPVARFAKTLKGVTVLAQQSLGWLTQLAAEQLHNLPVVQAYRALPRTLEHFDREQSVYLRTMRRSLFIRGVFTPTLEVLGIIGIAIAIAFGTRAISAEPELASKLLSFLAAALLMYQPVKSLSGTFSSVIQGLGSAERLFDIADRETPEDGGGDAPALCSELRLDRVHASYDTSREVLRGISMEIPAGKRIALVGRSGAGKTTLFSILLRFVAPQSGSITWDGRELSTLATSSVRARLAWVPQEPILFSGTVRHNLLFGKPDATEQELWEALRRAHADSFVRAFPRILDQPIGERGAALSGGQRQRLAIARAFLRQPSLLLLDEPTSALDAASEREVQAGLAELMAGRTTLVIAHRLSTVRDADEIYVLQDGEIVERGSHAELMARRGRYALLLDQGEVAC